MASWFPSKVHAASETSWRDTWGRGLRCVGLRCGLPLGKGTASAVTKMRGRWDGKHVERRRIVDDTAALSRGHAAALVGWLERWRDRLAAWLERCSAAARGMPCWTGSGGLGQNGMSRSYSLSTGRRTDRRCHGGAGVWCAMWFGRRTCFVRSVATWAVPCRRPCQTAKRLCALCPTSWTRICRI